ncbi:MAG: hypothetical protein EAZ11_05250 [Curvibacter sp.]|nr:MAG: hypothetical protein EAZ11_05250 [Curvibacter sp.]
MGRLDQKPGPTRIVGGEDAAKLALGGWQCGCAGHAGCSAATVGSAAVGARCGGCNTAWHRANLGRKHAGRAEQARITQAFTDAVAHQSTADQRPWKLVFRQSKIGPNALALPGGTILMTDEMVALVNADTQVLTAVLAHELGHVQQRHGLRMLVQATVLGAVGAVVLGDFSTLLAAVPALLGQAHYSREAEREADAHAVKVLKDAGLSPLHMVTLFEALEQERQRKASKATSSAGNADGEKDSASWLGIAFASHPSDADRIAYFRSAAQ